MTITDFTNEARDYAREHWWNGAGAAVVFFLIATFIWKRPENDWLLYAALVFVGAHAYVSTLCFGQSRAERRHREEITVAFLEEVKTPSREIDNVTAIHRPGVRRPGSSARPDQRPAPRLVAVAAR